MEGEREREERDRERKNKLTAKLTRATPGISASIYM